MGSAKVRPDQLNFGRIPELPTHAQGDIPRPGGQVEQARGLPEREAVQQVTDGGAPPDPIDAKAEEAVQAVVGGRDVREHLANTLALDPGGHGPRSASREEHISERPRRDDHRHPGIDVEEG